MQRGVRGFLIGRAMATYIPYSPAMDPLGMSLGQMTGSVGSAMVGQHFRDKDLKRLSDWVKFNQLTRAASGFLDSPADFSGARSSSAPAASTANIQNPAFPPVSVASPPIGMTPFPQMQSPLGQQLATQYLVGQLQAMMPPSPAERAEIAYRIAMARRANAEAEQMGMPEPGAQPPVRLGADNRYGLPEGSLVQFDRLENMHILNQPGKDQDRYSVPYLVRNLGFTPPEAALVRDIHYGLKPRASATSGDLLGEYNRWIGILLKSQFDPIWGEKVEGLQEVAGVAKQRIDEITRQMKEQGIPIPETPAQQARSTSTAESAPLSQQLIRLGGAEKWPVPAPLLLNKYPKLSTRLPGLSPDERAEVVGAVKDGMTEDEILGFFGTEETQR
jgi:hypothetical protein